MATSLVLLPYLQRWDGALLHVRLLLIPRGNPLDPLTAGAPNFPSAKFVFDVHLLPGLDALPTPGGSVFTTITAPVVPTALPAFNALASLYPIDPAPPVAVRPPNTQVRKHLPLSYQQVADFAPGRTNLVSTDDAYSCAMQAPPAKPFKRLPKPNPLVAWGKVIAILLRNPVLATAAGLIRTLDVTIMPTDLLKQGGFMRVTLAPTSDGAGLLAIPDGLKVYTTRIPALTASRDEMGAHGHSRDGKPRNPQVLVGLVLVDGWPIAHHVFEGNRRDAKTVPDVLRDLEQRFGLKLSDRALVLVANRLTAPASEHALAQWLESDFVCDRCGRRLIAAWRDDAERRASRTPRVRVAARQLQQWYRTLDQLLACKAQVEYAL